jgi:hypothetical protein
MQKTKYGRGAWMHGLREDIISECDDNLMVHKPYLSLRHVRI